MKRIFAGLLAAIFLCGMIPALAEPVSDAALLPLPMGDPNPASRFMFTGQSYIFRMVERDATWNADTMMNVTFEPCCRTDWHSHAGGQILIAVGGIGIHQVEGKEPELLLPGTVARVEPNVMHWHGSAGGWFQHIAVETNPHLSGFSVGDKVTDTSSPAPFRRVPAPKRPLYSHRSQSVYSRQKRPKIQGSPMIRQLPAMDRRYAPENRRLPCCIVSAPA